MEAALKHSHHKILPTHSVYWFLAGLALLYVEAAALLDPLGVPLLPHQMVQDVLRSGFGFYLLLLGIPCCIWVLGWRARDLFAWLLAPHTLTVDDEGLRADGTRIRWRDVREIIEQHADDRVILRHAGGTLRLRLDLWSDPDVLHESVLEQVVSRLLERVNHQVSAGKPVRFGPLVLGDMGLIHRGKLWRWDDIESIRLQDEVDQGYASRELVIVAQGKARKFDEAKVINAPVLLAYLSGRLAG
ncbi:hypothetical protein HJC10_20715 [Corallococcus exiguus]|nr:hypothetical protein [Corallococcus exiguus]NNB93930.1 hypothetical protein [Corallococcus exiguus]NNC05265.1 hypothetical protein [Corallococcus exiguus]NPC48884.1 hypothetical protein [Corallococcus exiguus]RKH85682.1 hypothetical protein D7X99_06020 [Corallococcus sp. AB032C]